MTGFGQIGDPGLLGTHQLTAWPIPGLNSPTKIEATYGNSTFALLPDGSLYAWGQNYFQSFGMTTPSYSYAPIRLDFLEPVTGFGIGWTTGFAFGSLSAPTDVEPTMSDLPTQWRCARTRIPSSERASFALSMPEPGRATVRIYDLAGRLVRTVLDEIRPAGVIHGRLDGRDAAGASTAAGVYLARLQVGDWW